MMHSYILGSPVGRLLRRLGLTAVLAGGTALAAQAQLNYTTAAATNTTTTYTDLGTTGTAIATATTDDANSTAQSIGFTFTYNGLSFTQFTLNTNGFIKLGSTAPSATAMFIDETANSGNIDPFESAADPNIIAPLNVDLTAGAAGGTEYRVATTGTAGARVCTIQWKNVQDKANINPTQYTNLSFQVRLYEGTNVVELVYAGATAGTTPASRYTQVGLKGTSFSNGQLVQVAKQAGTAWGAATFADYSTAPATGYLNTVNIASVAPPDAGRTFRFTPAVPATNDVAIRAIYTLGKIATPSALPQAVRIYIANLGTAAQTNVKITLTITGANSLTTTGTLASLAAGAAGTLTLANLPATLNPGTDTLKVSVPADDNNTNNLVTVTQLVTTNRLSYIDPNKALAGALSGSNSSAGSVLAAKYTIPSANTVTLSDALISFGNTGTTTAFQVVVYDATGTGAIPGNVLYTSPTQNRPAAGGNVTVTLPGLQLTGAFYVGVKEIGTTGAGVATQAESPLRATTFYYSADGASNWLDIAATTIQSKLGIEVGLAPAPSCAAPTGLAVTSTTATTATVSFTDASNTGSYQLIYGPTGFQPATGGTMVTATASPATLTGLQSGATYQVYVRTNCTGGGTSLLAGPVSFSTGCPATTVVSAFPYSETFDNIPVGAALPCGITVLDANADGATWAINKTAPNSSPNAMRYTSAISNSQAANDWFFTPALALASGTRYQLAFRYRGEGIANTTSAYIEQLEVKAGAAATPTGQTTTLYTNSNITNTSYALANGASMPAVAVLQGGGTSQYVGFHAISAATQGNLYIDDLSISTVLATSSAVLLKAVTVFPNPSTTGLFDLEIHGANAASGLAVQVSNALGQRVYTGTARDNYTNALDLSTLAPGLYYLQVRNGDETMTRQLAIVK